MPLRRLPVPVAARLAVWSIGIGLGFGLAPARADAAVKITDFKAGLLAASDPGPPVAGPDGNVWFPDAGAVGKITPTGQITEYTAGIQSGDAADAGTMTLGSDDHCGSRCPARARRSGGSIRRRAGSRRIRWRAIRAT